MDTVFFPNCTNPTCKFECCMGRFAEMKEGDQHVWVRGRRDQVRELGFVRHTTASAAGFVGTSPVRKSKAKSSKMSGYALPTIVKGDAVLRFSRTFWRSMFIISEETICAHT